MNLLAIDTAADACSVGIVAGSDVPVLRTQVIGRGHAETLMGMVAAAMAEAGLGYAALDRIAVTIGPGSFTGLRVGIAAARGLALVHGIETVGIGTLAVHAATVGFASGMPVMAVLAAGRGEVYGQRFRADGRADGPPRVASPQIFAAEVVDGMALAGSGADLVIAALPMTVRPPVLHRNTAPDIAALCRLALVAPKPSGPPKPLYIRAPDAKPQAAMQVPRR